MITVPCPHCDSELKGPDTFRGKRVRCKKCGEPFTIPMDDDVIEEVEVIDDEIEVIDDVEVVETKPKPKPKPRLAPVAGKPVRKPVVELDEVEEVDEEERRPSKKKKPGKVVKSGAAKVMIRLGILMIILGVVGMVVVGIREGGNGGVVAGGGNVVQGGGAPIDFGPKAGLPGRRPVDRDNDRGEPGDPEDSGILRTFTVTDQSGKMFVKEGKIIATLSDVRREINERTKRGTIQFDFTCVDGLFLGECVIRIRNEAGKVATAKVFPAVQKRKGTLTLNASTFFVDWIEGKLTIDILKQPDKFKFDDYESVTAAIEVPAK